MDARRSRIYVFLLLAVVGSLLLTPLPGAAQRSGFIIGVGAGPGYVSFPGSPSRTGKVTVATDFKIGYAPSEAWAIYWSADTHFYSGESDEASLGLLGVGGIGVTRFLRPDLPVAYVDGSLGFGTSGVFLNDGGVEQQHGLGLTLGTGLALSNIAFLDLDLLYTHISFDFGQTLTYYGVKVSINFLSN